MLFEQRRNEIIYDDAPQRTKQQRSEILRKDFLSSNTEQQQEDATERDNGTTMTEEKDSLRIPNLWELSEQDVKQRQQQNKQMSSRKRRI